MAVERGPNEILKLHTRDVEFGGLGGHKWSKSFASYIGQMRPQSVQEDHHRVSWWRILYVVNRLRQDSRVNQIVLSAYLAFRYEDDLDWPDVVDRYHVTKAQFGALDRYARRVYLA